MGVEIVCGDCFEVMAKMSDGSVDHIITDPPYAEKTHAGARTGGKDFVVTKLVKFDSIDDEQFIRLCEELVRVSRRWVVMTCDVRHLAKAVLDDSIPVIRCGAWVKSGAAPQFTGDRPGMGWEAVLILHRDGKKRWNGGGTWAVWSYPVARGDHPTQKPVNLIRDWVRSFTDPGETILDPFAGSGTTGVAAYWEKRNAILIEKNPELVEVARARMSEVMGKGRPPIWRKKQLPAGVHDLFSK